MFRMKSVESYRNLNPPKTSTENDMGKKLTVFLLLLVLAAACTVFIANASNKNYVVLKNGAFIEVDDAWTIDDMTLYEKNGEVLFIEKQATRNILTGPLKGPEDLIYRIFYYTIDRINASGTTAGLWFKTAGSRFGDWIAFVLLLAIGTTYLVLKLKENKKETSWTSDIIMELDSKAHGFRLAGISDIETFFLNIYKIQLGAPHNAPAKIERIQNKKSAPGHIYKLHVKMKGEWKSRAMTIGPLGEKSSGKSQCFYVIFDTHMVIKIPAEPIKDFSDYIQRIRYEGRIVGKLSPRECTIPNVSVIISKIKSLSIQDLPSDEIEEKYITFVGSSPEYQKYLKVGGNFAFFMNLSKYYFLSHVMEQLHHIEDQIFDVINADAGLILDCQEFENKYGKKNGWVCFELQKLFNQFDTDIRKLITHSDTPVAIDENQKKEWLFTHLAQQDITPHQWVGLPSSTVSKIHSLLHNITKKENKIVIAYRKLAKEYAKLRIYYRSKPKLEGIITNLLVLLVWLGENNVAMRDLKPDNLLVAGNPDNYPLFLSSVEEYAIGLIDLETAVDYRPLKNAPCEQPQLGGTPAYATPSHFFQNEIIEDVYQGLPLILNMQDWYATTAIVYEVVTGRRLFRQTAGKITELVMNMQQDTEEEQPLVDIFRKVNHTFWKSAAEEFKFKVSTDIRWLKATDALIPDDMKTQMNNHLLEGKKRIEHRIKEIHDATDGSDIPPSTPSDQSIGELEKLQKRSNDLSEWFRILEHSPLQVSVNDLLEIMFFIVLNVMVPESRETLSETNSRMEPDVSYASEEDKQDVTTGYTVTVALPS